MTHEQLLEVNKGIEEWGLENVENIILIKSAATNGDMIRAMFSNMEIMITDEKVFLRDGTIVVIYPLIWWNSPYQKGNKE